MTQQKHKPKLASQKLVVSAGVENESPVTAAQADLAQMSSDEFMQLLESASADELLMLVGEPEPPAAQKKKPFLRELVHVPEGERTPAAALIWWEGRRVIYNALVGAVGLPIAVLLFMVGMPIFAVIFGVIAYGIAANLCYTLGYGAELVAEKIFGPDRARRLAPELLVLGFVFSVLATVLGGFAFILFSTGVL